MTERALYGIGAAARLTGVPPATLRAWERRYDGLSPHRAPGGGRLYDEDDVARLRMVAQALSAGHRPSEVVGLPRRALERIVARRAGSPVVVPSDCTPTVDQCLEAARTDDARALRGLLRRAALLLPATAFLEDVVDPLLVRAGELWAGGDLCVHQEHVLTECVSTQLRVMLDVLEGAEVGPRIVLATFPDEMHGLGLEMIAVRVAAQAAAPRLLGRGCPPSEIASAVRAFGAPVVGISVSASSSPRATAQHLSRLLDELEAAAAQVWLGGSGAGGVRRDDRRVRLVDSWPEVDRALLQLRSAR
jgi:DNA-binding transcriptional MerR regulator